LLGILYLVDLLFKLKKLLFLLLPLSVIYENNLELRSSFAFSYNANQIERERPVAAIQRV
jgi:hypothetical protein